GAVGAWPRVGRWRRYPDKAGTWPGVPARAPRAVRAGPGGGGNFPILAAAGVRAPGRTGLFDPSFSFFFPRIEKTRPALVLFRNRVRAVFPCGAKRAGPHRAVRVAGIQEEKCCRSPMKRTSSGEIRDRKSTRLNSSH